LQKKRKYLDHLRGTADIPVAEEAAVTAESMEVALSASMMVWLEYIAAGHKELLDSANVIIVSQGWKAPHERRGGLGRQTCGRGANQIGYGQVSRLGGAPSMLNTCARPGSRDIEPRIRRRIFAHIINR